MVANSTEPKPVNGRALPQAPRNGTERRALLAPATIYGFAVTVMQRLNEWPCDGAQDYAVRIQELTHCLTANGLKTYLDDHSARFRVGELLGAVRCASEIPGRDYDRDRVIKLDSDSWRVDLDMLVDEGTRSSWGDYRYMHYPVRVVRCGVAPEINPFGLALDGYAGTVRELGTQRGTGRW
ncbi:MAG: DUF2895 family protein [Pseudomonadota bacterium]